MILVDGASHTIRISTETGYRGISTADLDENGIMEIWAGTTSGKLVKIDPADLTPPESWPVCVTSVNSVKINQADSMQGAVQIVCDDQALIFEPERGPKLWVSEPLPKPAGLANNLASLDIDNQNVMMVGHKLGISAFMGYGTGDADLDDDGVLNTADNCVLVPNPDQLLEMKTTMVKLTAMMSARILLRIPRLTRRVALLISSVHDMTIIHGDVEVRIGKTTSH